MVHFWLPGVRTRWSGPLPAAAMRVLGRIAAQGDALELGIQPERSAWRWNADGPVGIITSSSDGSLCRLVRSSWLNSQFSRKIHTEVTGRYRRTRRRLPGHAGPGPGTSSGSRRPGSSHAGPARGGLPGLGADDPLLILTQTVQLGGKAAYLAKYPVAPTGDRCRSSSHPSREPHAVLIRCGPEPQRTSPGLPGALRSRSAAFPATRRMPVPGAFPATAPGRALRRPGCRGNPVGQRRIRPRPMGGSGQPGKPGRKDGSGATGASFLSAPALNRFSELKGPASPTSFLASS